jgi:glycine/D-amino acid oxidase-like deaminating enzyme
MSGQPIEVGDGAVRYRAARRETGGVAVVETFDVGIVGGGIHGAAAAYHLAGRGVSVALFERGTPGSGPTGRSSAVCRAYYTNGFLARAARDSIAMFERYEELTGVDAGFRRTGFRYLHPPEDRAAMIEAVARLNGLGISTDLWEPDEVASQLPGFDLEGVGVAAFEHGAGHADPHAATEGLVRKATADGAAIRSGTAIVGLEPVAAGGGVLVSADGKRTACGAVLIAAGPWTRPLALQAGVDLPLTVERHIVGTFRWGSAAPVPAHGDLIQGYYFRPEGDAQFLMGPVHPEPEVDADDFAEEMGPNEVERLASMVVRRVPGLVGAESTRGWASLYDVSPDWQPVIGEIATGIFVDAGTSGHGFKLAPALGGHVADLVTGAEVDPGLAAFDPFRFERGEGLAAGYRDARILG